MIEDLDPLVVLAALVAAIVLIFLYVWVMEWLENRRR